MKLANQVLSSLGFNKKIGENLTKKDVMTFIKNNEKEIKTLGVKIAQVQFSGPTQDTKWINIDLATLNKITKVLK